MNEDVYEDLVAVIDELSEANLEVPVLVEGEKDVRALRELGLQGEVLPLNSGVSMFNLAEAFSRRHRRAIILTDGILRARFRNSLREPEPMEPGTPHELTVDLWATANVFLPGHGERKGNLGIGPAITIRKKQANGERVG